MGWVQALGWVLRKAEGKSTIGEMCRDEVVSFLSFNNIFDVELNYIVIGPSPTFGRFNERLYFGCGRRDGDAVYFLSIIDENSPYASGFLVDYVDGQVIKKLLKEHETNGSTFRFSLALKGLIEPLKELKRRPLDRI